MKTLATRDSIRRYYDKNTELFLRLGRENETYTIHRALWFQHIHDTPHALDASNELLFDAWRSWRAAHPHIQAPRVLDLGCGVGGTLFYLLTRDAELRGIGITLSAVQAELARARAAQIGLQTRALIAQGDFQAIPAAPAFTFAYSIEAFVHATQAEFYLRNVARVLQPGGRLVLCDDFRTARHFENANERAWLNAYQVGWHVPHLQTIVQVESAAARAGLRLVQNRALTPYLKLRALPDVVARNLRTVGERLPLRHPIVPSMLGSMALQQCLKMGLVEYRWLVLERT